MVWFPGQASMRDLIYGTMLPCVLLMAKEQSFSRMCETLTSILMYSRRQEKSVPSQPCFRQVKECMCCEMAKTLSFRNLRMRLRRCLSNGPSRGSKFRT